MTTIITNTFTVRGGWHHRSACALTSVGAQVQFIPEPDNKHDPNAIKLVVPELALLPTGHGDLRIGYVPKELTEYIKPLLPLCGVIEKLSWERERPLVTISFDANVFIPTQLRGG